MSVKHAHPHLPRCLSLSLRLPISSDILLPFCSIFNLLTLIVMSFFHFGSFLSTSKGFYFFFIYPVFVFFLESVPPLSSLLPPPCHVHAGARKPESPSLACYDSGINLPPSSTDKSHCQVQRPRGLKVYSPPVFPPVV